MRLDDGALLRLRGGERSPELTRAIDSYVGRMAVYFAHRAARATSVIDADDLSQIGQMALLGAVQTYQWRCSACMLATETESAFVRHVGRRHPGQPAIASPTLLRYVHAQVGRALDHEVRRYTRRVKFHGAPPTEPSGEATEASWVDRHVWVEPNQEHVAGLAMVLSAIQREPESESSRALRALVGKGWKRWCG